ncbi:MAG: hypothetical protein WCZ23_10730 [Rhodospirillaceae bacterium]
MTTVTTLHGYSAYAHLHAHISLTNYQLLRLARQRIHPRHRTARSHREHRHRYYRDMITHHTRARTLANTWSGLKDRHLLRAEMSNFMNSQPHRCPHLATAASPNLNKGLYQMQELPIEIRLLYAIIAEWEEHYSFGEIMDDEEKMILLDIAERQLNKYKSLVPECIIEFYEVLFAREVWR